MFKTITKVAGLPDGSEYPAEAPLTSPLGEGQRTTVTKAE
jgi:hypothetical protein